MTKKKPKNALKLELQKLKECVPQNPVAKFAHHVNKAGFFRDHTVYSRKGKHKDRESFRIRYLVIMNTKGFIFHQQKNLPNV
jgi:hypothetical protein